jgi:hypothetical protein
MPEVPTGIPQTRTYAGRGTRATVRSNSPPANSK